MEHPLKTARTRKDLTQQQLAERAHVHWTTVSKIENRTRQPSLGVARRLGRALGIDWKLLLED